MLNKTFSIRVDEPDIQPLITQLCDAVFGPGRFARTASRLRENAVHAERFNLTAWEGDALAGAIHFTQVEIGGKIDVFLLGPLVVHVAFAKRRCGMQLIDAGLEHAAQLGAGLILLVGDLPYYSKSGFQAVPIGQICFPGPVDPKRILARELREGVLPEYKGLVRSL